MQNIALSIVNLTRKAEELRVKYGANHWAGHKDMRNLWIRLRGERDGLRYAVEMLGLRFIEDAWDNRCVVTAGHIEKADCVRQPLFAHV